MGHRTYAADGDPIDLAQATDLSPSETDSGWLSYSHTLVIRRTSRPACRMSKRESDVREGTRLETTHPPRLEPPFSERRASARL